MKHFAPFIRLNKYLFWIIVTLFIFFPLLLITYQYSVPYEHVLPNSPNGSRYERYCRQVYQRINTEKILNYSVKLRPGKGSIPYSYTPWSSTPILPRLLTQCEHAIYMDLLSILIENVFEKYNIPYMMM